MNFVKTIWTQAGGGWTTAAILALCLTLFAHITATSGALMGAILAALWGGLMMFGYSTRYVVGEVEGRRNAYDEILKDMYGEPTDVN